MSAEDFKVSDDFEMFEVKAETALQEVRKAERRSVGFPLNVGDRGTAMVIKCEGGKSPVKEYQGKVTGGNPMMKMAYQIVTPEEHKGKKVYRNFVFNETVGMTAAGRYQMWVDHLESIGLPREIREKGPTAEYLKWLSEEPRIFDFTVVANQYESGNDNKELRAVAKNTQPLPGASNTEAALSAATSIALNDEVQFSGIDAVVVEVLEGGRANIKFPNGKSMQVDVADLTKK